MQESPSRIPVYAKAALLFIALYAFVYTLYIGQGIIVPLIFSALFAVLLNPVVRFFERTGLPRIPSIVLTLLVAFFVVSLVIYFFSSQLSGLGEKLPVLQQRLEALINELVDRLAARFPVSKEKLLHWITTTRGELIAHSGTLIGSTLTSFTGFLFNIVLMPIYIFMIIYYEPLFVGFVRRVFHRDSHSSIGEMLTESKVAMQQYLVGLLVENAIVAVLNVSVLLMLKLEYAVLLGVTGAMLNVIPYIGGIIGVSLYVLMALVTKDSFTAVYAVIAAHFSIQFIDNNVLLPRIVASKVKINALMSIVAVLIGGALWGIPGMFLSIPLTAVVKIVCDRVEPLKPYGYLLGVNMPRSDKSFFRLLRRKRTMPGAP